VEHHCSTFLFGIMQPLDKQKQSKGNIQPQQSANPSELEGGQASPPGLISQAAHAHATRFQHAKQQSETDLYNIPLPPHQSQEAQPKVQRKTIFERAASQVPFKDTPLSAALPSKGEKLLRTPVHDNLRASPLSGGLPVGTVNAIRIATQLAPHVAKASTALELEQRLDSARKEMQRQLHSQRAELELTHLPVESAKKELQRQLQSQRAELELTHLQQQEKFQEKATSALLVERQNWLPKESARKETLRQLDSQRAELELSHHQEQEKASSALLLEQQKSAELSAKLAQLEHFHGLTSTKSQPILVHSSSRSKNDQETPQSSSLTMPPPLSVSPTKATSEQQVQAVHEHDLQLQAEYALLLKQQLALLLPKAVSEILQAQQAVRTATPVQAPTLTTKLSALTLPAAPAQPAPRSFVPIAAAAEIGVARLQAEEATNAKGHDTRSTLSTTRQAAIAEQEAYAAKQHKLNQKRQTAIAQQEAQIAKAQKLILSLQELDPITSALPKPRKSAREREKELALFSNDKDSKDLLKHGSHKLESEEESDDDEADLRREQGRAIAFHNLMNPKSKIPLKNPEGYTPCAFIKPEDEEDSEEEEESEVEIDDDQSPDYVESVAASPERTLSKDDWEQWQALKRGQTPLQTTDLPAILSAIISSNKPSHEGKLQVALNPPAHGEWDDVNHLMKIYLPLYEKYKASCGSKTAESIFSAYSATQKRRLAKLFTKHSEGRIIHSVDVEDLELLTNEAFCDMLCKEKGYKTSTLTEDALKAIVWKGRFTDKSSWINHETNWEDCLAQTSKKGTVDKKRLIVLYRQSIPEPFIQKHLASKRFDTWQECHNYMAEDMLKDPDFFTEWNEDVRTRALTATPQDKHDKKQGQSSGGGVAPPRQDKQHNPAPAGAATPSTPVKVNEGSLTYRDKHGKLNVNPNLIVDLDLNPDKLVCGRCGLVHRWLEEFCTAFKNKLDQLIEPKLTFEQIKKATIARWHAGFFAAKDPNKPHRDSPSVQATASAAAETQKRLALPH
jgi:hypothetical protein